MASRKLPYRRPLAIEDIANHSHLIAEHNPIAALRFLDAVESTVHLLCEFPEAGGVMPTNRTDTNGLRAKLVNEFGSYVILYFVTESTIDIARVVRGGLELDQLALNAS